MSMYQQNNMYNPGMMGGMAYGMPQQQKPKMVNPLTAEEREALKVDNSFNLAVTPSELAEAVCTHKHPEKGEFATVPNPDGSVTCTICHQTFFPDVVDEGYVKNAVDMAVNALQTCKFLTMDQNPDIIRGYYQMIPYLIKLPQLFKMCHHSYMKYNNAAPQTQQMGGANYFNMYNMMTNPMVPLGGMGMMGGYGMQQPVTPTQQMASQAVPGGMSPFYANPAAAPAMGMPFAPPMYAAPAAAPEAAPAAPTATIKETVQL